MTVSQADILQAKILIVDDQAANVLLLERLLRGAGYSAVASTTAPEEVCALHRKNRYDLILLDLEMPGMDGFQVMADLKQLENEAYLPVLVVTVEPEHKLRALKDGARDFVSKPFDLPEVLMRIRNMLEVRLLYKRAEDLTKLKTSLVALVSHEIGNVLFVMKLTTNLIEDNSPPKWRKKNDRYIDILLTSIDGLKSAVKNLLNLGRIEAGKLAVEFTATDAAEILKGAAKSMELLCEQKELRVSLKLPDDPRAVRADPACLILAVSNLLSNAIKYTPKKGRIALGMSAEKSRPGYYRIFVEDTGIGVSVKDRSKILSGHYRSERGKKMTAEGFGVGLSLTQQIVEAHGSSIKIGGAPGKGSRFSFLLQMASP
jgi:signal transduction histidine kinase